MSGEPPAGREGGRDREANRLIRHFIDELEAME